MTATTRTAAAYNCVPPDTKSKCEGCGVEYYVLQSRVPEDKAPLGGFIRAYLVLKVGGVAGGEATLVRSPTPPRIT